MTTSRENSSHPPVIVFSPNHWSERRSSRRRIATGLAARGWPLIYTTGPLSLWQRDLDEWASSRLLGGTGSEDGLLVDRPGKLETYWPRSPVWARHATTRHANRLRRVAQRTGKGGPLTAFLFHPKFWPNAMALRPDRVVYFVYDALSLTPGWNEERADFERQLVERADLIVATSAAMYDYTPERARQIGKEMPGGVDLDRFVGAHERPCPPDLAAIPTPRIGYTGNINQKLDFTLMHEVARESPHLNFVFVGPAGPHNGGVFEDHPAETQAWAQFLALPNAHHLGPKEFADVPAYMAHMDVNVMCYRLDGGWWQAGYPLKMHEYLAVGKPVVSTGQHAVLPFGAVIDIVPDAAAWRDALERALSAGGVGTLAGRREVAKANSWDVRLDNLSGWMEQAIGVSPAAG